MELNGPWKGAVLPAPSPTTGWQPLTTPSSAAGCPRHCQHPDLRVAGTRVEQAGQLPGCWRRVPPWAATINLFGLGGLKMGGGDMSFPRCRPFAGVSWEPDLWGRPAPYGRNRGRKATYVSTMADLEFARQSLAATVAKAWFTASETWLQRQDHGTDDQVRPGAGQAWREALAGRRRHRAGCSPGPGQPGSFQDAAKQVLFAHGQTLRAWNCCSAAYPATELQARNSLGFLSPPLATQGCQ